MPSYTASEIMLTISRISPAGRMGAVSREMFHGLLPCWYRFSDLFSALAKVVPRGTSPAAVPAVLPVKILRRQMEYDFMSETIKRFVLVGRSEWLASWQVMIHSGRCLLRSYQRTERPVQLPFQLSTTRFREPIRVSAMKLYIVQIHSFFN